MGALFRKGDDWAVFSVKDGRARTALVKIGNRNSRLVEILSGLSDAARADALKRVPEWVKRRTTATRSIDRVVLHPSDRKKDGVAVSERENQ